MNIDELRDAESGGPIISTMKVLNLIFIAFLLGQLTFAGVVYFLHQSETLVTSNELHVVLQYAVPLVAVTFIGLTKIVHDKILAGISETQDINNKLGKYRVATMIRLAGLEGANIFTLAAYLLTGQAYYLYIFGIIIVLFFMAKPSVFKFHEQSGE